MKKITWYNSPYDLAEESQKVDVQYSLLSGDNVQCHPWVKCRDFLHDAVRCVLTNSECNIYGFKYGSEMAGCAPVDVETMRMLVTSSSVLNTKKRMAVANFHRDMLSAVRLLNYYEKLMNLHPTHMERCRQDDKHFWYFTSPKFWLRSPALVSLHSMLIRLGTKRIKFKMSSDTLVHNYANLVIAAENKLKEGDRLEKDLKYLDAVGPKIAKVLVSAEEKLMKGDDFDPIYWQEISINDFHNHCGIFSLCSGAYTDVKTMKAVNL